MRSSMSKAWEEPNTFGPRTPAERAMRMAAVEDLCRVRIFGAEVDVALGRAGGDAGDDHALDEGVGVALHDHAVGEGAGVAFVGVGDDVFLARRALR